jgi:hypothetical protein
MPVSEFRLNRFERILFRIAIVLAAVIVAVRVGAMAALWLLHHSLHPGEALTPYLPFPPVRESILFRYNRPSTWGDLRGNDLPLCFYRGSNRFRSHSGSIRY